MVAQDKVWHDSGCYGFMEATITYTTDASLLRPLFIILKKYHPIVNKHLIGGTASHKNSFQFLFE